MNINSLTRKASAARKKETSISNKLSTAHHPIATNEKKKIERELTPEEEKAAFLHTSKINSAKIFAEYLFSHIL